MNKENGGQAFPGKVDHGLRSKGFGEVETIWSHERGMTLRDWFAGQALIGLLTTRPADEIVAKWAYSYADAMLAERSKP
jgi:hypothetical protein